jgi:hypothetical protein
MDKICKRFGITRVEFIKKALLWLQKKIT